MSQAPRVNARNPVFMVSIVAVTVVSLLYFVPLIIAARRGARR